MVVAVKVVVVVVVVVLRVVLFFESSEESEVVWCRLLKVDDSEGGKGRFREGGR